MKKREAFHKNKGELTKGETQLVFAKKNEVLKEGIETRPARK